MATRVPKQALSLLANTVVMASKYGLKQGIGKAAAKANPALMLLEAAVSVADAVNSYLKLKEAKARRNGLSQLIPHEEKRLDLERKQLAEQIELAKKDLAQTSRLQERLGKLVLACSSAYRTAWDELHALRSSDLPDIEAFDAQLIELEDVWGELQHALQIYNETNA
ncbi:hypothetical protein [Marinobacter sp.]|uniref:hypothetical protein n=1 Tax=Marinobacter sp. TaxID=50741 RepID=UPI00199EE8EC|nr:hypothetical protein [Marinobacter sp.]MBC7190768.1 hypothetical protein [Marinobacter sp.]